MELRGVRVVHAIPGRVRLKIKQLRDEPGLAREVEAQLEGVPGVRQVEVNPQTGSVVVLFDAPEGTSKDSVHFLSTVWPERLGRFDVQTAEAGLSGGGNGHGTHAMDRRIVDFFGSLNTGVSRATSGIDLKVLVPLTLFFLGMRSLLFSEKVPVPAWYDFFWFALSTFIMLNSTTLDETVEAQARLRSAP